MPRNPNTGMLSTKCPSLECGRWNDWLKIPGSGNRWDKPLQCKCGRQLKRTVISKIIPITQYVEQQRLGDEI